MNKPLAPPRKPSRCCECLLQSHETATTIVSVEHERAEDLRVPESPSRNPQPRHIAGPLNLSTSHSPSQHQTPLHPPQAALPILPTPPPFQHLLNARDANLLLIPSILALLALARELNLDPLLTIFFIFLCMYLILLAGLGWTGGLRGGDIWGKMYACVLSMCF